ncbi:unnamed protein product, partial [marine sediment metagenome]
LFVSVTKSGVGNALFKVTDIYTGTLDGNNGPIQGINGAKVKVQNVKDQDLKAVEITS